MSDTKIDIEKVTEEFDVFGWLEGTQQPSNKIEIYNDGPVMLTLKRLTERLQLINEKRQSQEAQLLRADAYAITDEENDGDEAIIDEIERLRESLRGTGVIFEVTAITPGEREVLAKSTARKLKAKPSKGKLGDDDYEDAIPGGEEHPDYNVNFTNELVARCIASVTNQAGAVSKKPWTAAGVQKLRATLPGVEYSRLSNEIFSTNYMSYDIDQMVDVDFSSRP